MIVKKIANGVFSVVVSFTLIFALNPSSALALTASDAKSCGSASTKAISMITQAKVKKPKIKSIEIQKLANNSYTATIAFAQVKKAT